ncbi:helix-turn-helix domain-containing protein [Frankia sp. Cas4]|uniref:helix-turn-helix domain-containing protein n=1 Tax=Frankia sp. Cas4 TaxID=3073927 RepID=UPI002AD29D96|nr:helix-turn-helix domain-containing protein [Frankia sp. Cas4]
MSNVEALPAPPLRVLLTVEEAADRLRIGRTTLYGLIGAGQIVSVRIGRLRRLRPVDVEAYAVGLSPITTAPEEA